MTTFHELLGTEDGMSSAEVKKRFKSISMRVHPDRGGSDALMRIVSQSYNFVQKGQGNKEVFNSVTVEKGDVTQLKAKIRLLEKENRQLKEAYDRSQKENSKLKVEIKDQVAEQFTQQRRQDKTLLEANEELKKLAQTLKTKDREYARLEAEYNSYREKREHSVSLHNSNKKGRKGNWLFLIVGCLLTVGLIANMPGLSEKLGALYKTDTEEKARKVTIQRPLPSEPEAESQTVEVPGIIQAIPTKPVEYYDIRNVGNVGLWGNFTYLESKKPYIAVKSRSGSYVVKGCNGGFHLYLNQNDKPLRVSPNLSYLLQSDTYHVYEIQYGNGSAIDNWFDSNSLLINSESFSNHNFAQAINRHNQICLVTGNS